MIQPQYANPYMQGAPSANAVNIQIFEPKAYASPAGAMAVPSYTNQFYSYPQASLYNPQQPYMPYPAPMQYPVVQQYPPMPQPYGPMMPQQYPQAPQGYGPQPQQYPQPEPHNPYAQPNTFNPYAQPGYGPQVMQPQPQQMPEPAIQPQQPAPDYPQPQTNNEPQVQVQPQPQAPTVDIQNLVNGLQSTDPAVQEATITKIADLSQDEPAKAQQVLNEQVMSNLAGIISKDISGLQGPTPEQVAILEKAAKGQPLNEQETQLAQQLSPQAVAAKNKIISMFTLAMLQKNQRDELDAYMASQGNQNIKPLQMQDLIGFNEIQNAIQNDPNPEIRLAGVQAISYVARPEDAQAVQMALQASLNDPEPLIQQAAQETMAKIGMGPLQTTQG